MRLGHSLGRHALWEMMGVGVMGLGRSLGRHALWEMVVGGCEECGMVDCFDKNV